MGGRSVRTARGRCPHDMRRRHGYARTLSPTALAASARGGPSALQLLLPARLPTPRLPARAAALGACAEGSAGRDACCEAKAGHAPGGHRVFDLHVQQRSTKCCSALPLAALSCCCCSAFFSCNGSLAVSPSTLCLSVPPSSFLRPPLSLPSPCFSAFSPSLSFFLSARVLLFAQFQRLSLCWSPDQTTSPCNAGNAPMEAGRSNATCSMAHSASCGPLGILWPTRHPVAHLASCTWPTRHPPAR